MELLHGENLLQRFKRCGRLSWRDVLAIVRAVCHSLDEAHVNGIVHRDLKPANIHLSTNDFVKVLDFGVAKMLPWSNIDDGSELTLAGQTVGTLEYMAPEQLGGMECDARADIYALGVVAYEMIVGRRPFAEALNAPSLITALFTQRPPAPSSIHRHVPPMVDQLLLRCLELEPADRFASAHELLASIDRLLGPSTHSGGVLSTTGAGLQTTDTRRLALAPTIAYQLPVVAARPSQMPVFDVPVRGTMIDAEAFATRERRWLFWVAALAAALVGVAFACLV
jgi:serine/threonine-protein kinase